MSRQSILRFCAAVGLCAGATLAALAAEPAGPWRVKPDSRIDLKAAADAAQATGPSAVSLWSAADPAYIRPNQRVRAPMRDRGDVVLAKRPSRFVMVVFGFGEGWELWDLGRGVRASSGRGKIDLHDPLLSPDGQYIAGYVYGGADGQRGEIWSLKTGLRVSLVKGEARSFGIRILDFVGDDRFAYIADRTSAKTIHIAKIDTSADTAVITCSSTSDDMQFSPTGKYMLVPGNKQLEFYSTDDGSLAGRLSLEDDGIGGNNRFSYERYKGLTFSADGNELAVLHTGNKTARISVFDMATGKRVLNKSFEYESTFSSFSKLTPLEYLPDNSGWLLFGRSIVDRQSMVVVHTLDEVKDLYMARPIARDQVLQLVITRQVMAAEAVKLPMQEITKASQIAKAGGNPEDALLPPLTRPDLSQMETVVLEGALAQPWNVDPQPVANLRSMQAPTVAIRPAPRDPKDPSARAPQDDVTAILFTSNQTNAAIVEHAQTEPGKEGGPFQRRQTWIERYDLGSGTASPTTELPALVQALDVSDTGTTLACRGGSDRDRLELYTFENARFKPLASFRPFVDLPVVADDKSMRSGQSAVVVADAAVIDDTHVLALSESGTLICWQLPTAKALWRSQADGAGKQLALSPDRKLGAVPIAGGVCVFDPMTGRALNGLPADATELRVTDVAFSPDGMQLIAKAGTTGGMLVQVYDLKTGSTKAQVVAPYSGALDSAQPLQILSDDYLLVNGESLMSTKYKCLVWRYHAPRGGMGGRLRGGSVNPCTRSWYALPKAGRLPNMLVSVPLPHAEVSKSIGNVRPEDLFEWAPGMTVSLNISVVGDDAFRKVEVQRWTEGLTRMSFKVVAQSPNVLTANTFLMNGETVQYTTHMSSEKFSLTQKIQGYNIRLTVGGKEVWKTVYDQPPKYSGSPSIIMLQIQPGESAQAAANRQNPEPKTASAVFMPPQYIFKDRTVPDSQITVRGLQLGR